MDWLRKKMQDPQAHLIIAGVLAVAKFFPQTAPFAVLLDTLIPTLIGTAWALPEQAAQPAAPAAVVLPSGASMHAQDWMAMINGVVNAVSDAKGRK